MRSRLIGWLSDTLAKRLVWLMWATLVGSHLLAFGAFVATRSGSGGPPPHAQGPERPEGDVRPDPPLRAEHRPGLPVFPSLPPTPGVPDSGPGGGRSLPFWGLVLDYGVRLLVIALAAWAGARWLTQPLRRLAGATRRMADALRRGQATPRLDETAGPREVQALAHEFNRMSEQLQQEFQRRGLMVAAISHDLRTPITRLRMRLETQDDSPALRERAIDDLREMGALIDSVLTVFRPRAGQPDEALQPVSLGALLQAMVDDLVDQGQDVSFEGGDATVRAQPLALRRVLDNLVGNALRYGQRARLRIVESATGHSVEVDDDGPGIPDAQQAAVFEPFVRLEGSRHRQTGGVGLGLYIARQLADDMGAQLSLRNREAGGLRVRLHWPRN